ncbi:MAG: 4-hydroxy-tetrahydrodipicolinate reductase [Tidjanibacter sp.]|nr:4-hydroxy-tetrahydrodipicolinate reductase [Tidjanibacter sp.]
MKAAIIGYGKMGREIEKVLIERGHEVTLKIDIDNSSDLNEQNLKDIDVAIEFTSPATAYANVRKCLECGTAVVCGSTGWNDGVQELKEYCRANGGAFFYSSNYSVGMNVMFKLNKILAAIMNSQPEYNVSMEETHHIHKLDSPSGTAVTLAEGIMESVERKTSWVNQATDKADEIGIISYREGEVPGIHTVIYDSEADTLELKHSAKSRRGLVLGAVLAAEFLQGKQGVFSMDDMLKF